MSELKSFLGGNFLPVPDHCERAIKRFEIGEGIAVGNIRGQVVEIVPLEPEREFLPPRVRYRVAWLDHNLHKRSAWVECEDVKDSLLAEIYRPGARIRIDSGATTVLAVKIAGWPPQVRYKVAYFDPTRPTHRTRWIDPDEVVEGARADVLILKE